MAAEAWFLECYIGDSKRMRRLPIGAFPFRVGRQNGLELTLDSVGVSRIHAEIITAPTETLILCDLGSTNGTYVNRQRIAGAHAIHPGDIIHFADQEFRLGVEAFGEFPGGQTQIGINTLSKKMPEGGQEFKQLLATEAVSNLFQPIVDRQGRTIAFELLGRGTHAGLPTSPGPLFKIAESMDLDVQFSDLLRRRAVEQAAALEPTGRYFFNIHPREIEQTDLLLARMTQMRQSFPRLGLVLEIHEEAVTDGPQIQRIRDHLKDLEIGLAYDDFGAGQARLVELTEVPPDYVKFDMALVRDIDRASDAKRQMLAMFQQFLRGLGITTIAEGVETASEASVLYDIGIDLYQGYYFGIPRDRLY